LRDSLLEHIQRLIEAYAIKVCEELELKDVARIDFRLDIQNKPKIIDVNPLPGLSPLYSDLTILYKLKGSGYNTLIKIILQESFKRYGFNLNKKNA